MRNIPILHLVFFTIALLQTALAVTVSITSSPPLDLPVLCVGANVTLTCHSTQPSLQYDWYWGNNHSAQGDTITVTASQLSEVYRCAVSNSGQELGSANITVECNGVPPVIKRVDFNYYILAEEGSEVNLTTATTSDLPISPGYPQWSGYERPLPSHYNIVNYTIGGVLYNSLLMYNLSYEDDSGNYTITVSNQCGSTMASVFVQVEKVPKHCIAPGTTPPIINGPVDFITVQGQSASFSCQFKGNYEDMKYDLINYWTVTPGINETTDIVIDNSTTPYFLSVYQTCGDESCCQFTTQLTVLNVSLTFSAVTVTCKEALEVSPNAVSAASAEFTVLDVPRVITGPVNTAVSLYNDVTFKCQFSAPTMDLVTIVVWLKDNVIIQFSDRHIISTRGLPGENDVVYSLLTIHRITVHDEGVYTCYCYYNRSMVTTTHFVKSDQKSAILAISHKEVNILIIVFCILVAIIIFILWASGCGIFLMRRSILRCIKRNDKDSELDPLVVKPEEETVQQRSYGTGHHQLTWTNK